MALDSGTVALLSGGIVAVGTVVLAYFAWRAHLRARQNSDESRREASMPAAQEAPTPRPRVSRSPRTETLYDATVEVESGGHEAIPLQLISGDRLKGVLRSRGNYDFDADLLDERNYGLFLNGKRFRSIWKERRVAVTTVDARVLSEGSYYLVLDLYGKQLDRQVSVRLQRLGATDPETG